MNDTCDQSLRELEARIAQLPENERRAMGWLISNYKVIEQMCRMEPLTPAQREAHMRKAREKNDIYRVVMLIAEQRINAPQDEPAQE